jgi:TetR/AcrR family transcriptional regulator
VTDLTFQRARKPEERELRRETILAAAAELFDAEGQQGTGLNAIAARAGFTKSNVYRYFESREEVLISLFLREFEAFVPALEARFEKIDDGDLPGIARATTATFVERPRLGHLISILSTVLEQNVSAETVVSLKRNMQGYVVRLAAAIHSRLPSASIEDCAWVGSMVGTIVAGMWPGAHPSEIVREVLQRPEFANLKPSVERDLERAALALLESIEH